MKETDSSSWQTVSDLSAARSLLKADERRFLGPFLGRELSTAQAAHVLGVAMDSMAYRVRRFAGLGLLTRTREETRKGRPIKFYRAAPGFRIPIETLPFADLEELFVELDAPLRHLALRSIARLAEAAGLHAWTVRLFRDARGSVQLGLAPPDGEWHPEDFLRPEVPALLFNWVPLHLSAAQAKELQAELLALVSKYQVSKYQMDKYQEEADTPDHLLGVFMTPCETGL